MNNEKEVSNYLGWKVWNPTDAELAELYVEKEPKEPFPLL